VIFFLLPLIPYLLIVNFLRIILASEYKFDKLNHLKLDIMWDWFLLSYYILRFGVLRNRINFLTKCSSSIHLILF
jgi:hypothetical protein